MLVFSYFNPACSKVLSTRLWVEIKLQKKDSYNKYTAASIIFSTSIKNDSDTDSITIESVVEKDKNQISELV